MIIGAIVGVVVCAFIALYVAVRRVYWRDKRCLRILAQDLTIGVPCIEDEKGKVHLYRPIRNEGTVCGAPAFGHKGGLAYFFGKDRGMPFCHRCLQKYDPMDCVPSDMVRKN